MVDVKDFQDRARVALDRLNQLKEGL